MSVAKTVIQNLILNREYAQKVFPFITAEYFRERTDRVLFEIIADYVSKYSTFPSLETVGTELTLKHGVDDIEFEECKETLTDATQSEDIAWLVDTTEKFAKQRAVELAIGMAAAIIADDKGDKNGIPQLLQDALAISFETNIGHDYLEDWECRFNDYYHDPAARTPFHIDYLNRVTGGGVPSKSLTVILAGTGVGKSMLMCDMAAHHLMAGKNVLYITMELSEDMISERIDANLLDTDVNLLRTISKKDFEQKIERLKGRTHGTLKVKEYATTSAGAAHFRYLLNELKIKSEFVPDVIYVDYINLCLSTRYKNGPGSSANSYTIVKMIAEELRGLAVDYKIPLITATQTTRAGFTSTDVGLEDTSESFGLPATADFMFSISQDEEMKILKQVLFKQLKNRFRDVEMNKKYIMGVEKNRMRFFELEASAQQPIINTSKEKASVKSKFDPATKGKFARFR